MKNMINISNYDFHDGILSEIVNVKDNIIITMESSQICSEDNIENVPLSDSQTIKGKLHIEGVKSLTKNGKALLLLEKNHDSGDIFDFVIEGNYVKLLVMWDDYPPKPYFHSDMITYEITADQIYWENIP